MMDFKYAKLRSRIKEKYGTEGNFSTALGISQMSLSRIKYIGRFKTMYIIKPVNNQNYHCHAIGAFHLEYMLQERLN